MPNAQIVLTTVSTQDAAQTLAELLLERRLAACVNIVGPIHSVYRWKGTLEREQEFLLIVKTTAERVADLSAAFREIHPYQLPELVQLPIAAGSQEYLAWLSAEVGKE